ncbi:MAG: flippase-like domain-containing protein [Cyclobacteriaceae bacterium]|nr:flippase-like domain-containing protein [Cyclobacteriaceae bacterium]
MNLSISLLTTLKKFTQQYPRTTKAGKLILKILLSGLALGIVSTHVNWTYTWQLAKQVPWYALLGGWVLYNLSKVISAWRLWRILKIEEIHVSPVFNLKLYYQGMFYNLFLPGGVGGDAYKTIILHRLANKPLRSIVAALILDRISGVAALLLLAACFAILLQGELPTLYTRVAWVLLIALVPGWYVLQSWFFKKSISEFFPVLLLSGTVQLVQVLQAWLLLAFLDVKQGWFAYGLVFLLSSLATLLPITIGGIGARELVFVFAAHHLGISQDAAIAFSILFFMINVLSSLPGVFIKTKHAYLEKGG